MPKVLHILPHLGGGAETYIDLLAGLDGFVHERAALSTGRTPAAAASSIPRHLPGLLRASRRADLLHLHGDAASMIALPVPALARRPAVWTTHGLHLLRRRPAVAPGVRAAIAVTAATLCTSQAELDELAALAPRQAGRLVLARNGLPLGPPTDPALRAAVRAELGLADGELAVLFLGQLEQRKGVLDAVAAATAARDAGAPVTLLVAGDGPLAPDVAAQAGPAVRRLGFRDDPERLLAGADVFVLPSAREGLAFAVIEAMRAGLAVVVADGPGNPEAVGDAGIVVPGGDLAALAGALQELAGDSRKRAGLGAAARERVAHELTVEHLLDGVLAGYRMALGGFS
jgi:glycosyltransferase involved in cell wall biosynthesis